MSGDAYLNLINASVILGIVVYLIRLERLFNEAKAVKPVDTKSEVPTTEEEEDETEEDEVEDKDGFYLGFPSKEIAEHVVAQLGKPNINVSCSHCKAKTPRWNVQACTSLPVDDHYMLALVLSCPTCASIRLVNPLTLGALKYDEDTGTPLWSLDTATNTADKVE
jgi:hypothetical protein